MKKITTIILTIIIMNIILLSGCENSNYTISTNWNYNYIVIKEKENYVLHKIKNWKEFSTNSITITTDCCNNKIWLSNINGNLYAKKPNINSYDIECNYKYRENKTPPQ